MVICFGLLPERNEKFCQFNPGDDYEDDQKWKRVISIYSFVYGIPASQIFEQPDWLDTIMFDIDIAMYFWNEVYTPTLRGRI